MTQNNLKYGPSEDIPILFIILNIVNYLFLDKSKKLYFVAVHCSVCIVCITLETTPKLRKVNRILKKGSKEMPKQRNDRVGK